jgi:hypothetical protein
MHAERMKRQQGKREACQALQTGGPWPKQGDVLRLPNRDQLSFEDPAVYVQRKAVSVVPRSSTTNKSPKYAHLSDQSNVSVF